MTSPAPELLGRGRAEIFLLTTPRPIDTVATHWRFLDFHKVFFHDFFGWDDVPGGGDGWQTSRAASFGS